MAERISEKKRRLERKRVEYIGGGVACRLITVAGPVARRRLGQGMLGC